MGSVELGLAPARRHSSWKPAPSARTEDFSASRNAARSPTGAIDVNTAYEQTLALLELPEPPTAILSVNNIAVVGVAEAARDRGLEIPRDLAVVCFDDIEHASRSHPFLTVMAQRAESFGTIATQLLLDRIAGRIEKRRRLIVLPADFVVRESCGAAAGENT